MFNKMSFAIVLLLLIFSSLISVSAQSISELPIQFTESSDPISPAFEDGALLLRYACQYGNVQEACQKINFPHHIARPTFEDGALLLRYACQYGYVQEACDKINGN